MIEFQICLLVAILGLLGGIAAMALTIIYDPKMVQKIQRLAGRNDLQ